MLVKNEIRALNKAKRSEMSRIVAEQKSLVAAKFFLTSELYENADCLMLYMPLGNETDTSEIIKAAFMDGKKVIFPTTDAKSGEITAYYADENTMFAKGAFSVYEPTNAEKADLTEIDVVIVPGIAFDRSGARVGFGKGCYDRFLKEVKALKIGFCYEFQICDKIVGDEHDVSMNYLITENGIHKCKGI